MHLRGIRHHVALLVFAGLVAGVFLGTAGWFERILSDIDGPRRAIAAIGIPATPLSTPTAVGTVSAPAVAATTPPATASPTAWPTATVTGLSPDQTEAMPTQQPASPPEPAATAPEAVAAPEALPPDAPSPTPRPWPERVTVPILMYHYIRDMPAGSRDLVGRGLSVSPALFRTQMELLEARGYTSVHLEDVLAYLRGGPDLPERPVVISFDDGYQDNIAEGVPALREHGFTGSFSIITSLVGRPGYMTWDDLHELVETGNEIGSHTVTHPSLPALSDAELARQLAESRQTLAEELGITISVLCYPSGQYNGRVMAAARTAGYDAATTVLPGSVHTLASRYELRRVRVHGLEDLAAFAAKLPW